MSSFAEKINILGDAVCFDQIRSVALSELERYSREQLNLFYEDLERGKGILDDDDHLNMYLRSFGKMHKAKIDAVLSRIRQLGALCSEQLEIYDWGCGQGLATICFLDYLKANRYSPNIVRVNLIEPSSEAVKRAKTILSQYPAIKGAEINVVNKKFDDIRVEDITSLGCRKLHLFSNILDVTTFDLVDFTHLFQKTQTGANYIISVGPFYSNNRRTDDFIAAINPNQFFYTIDLGRGQWVKDWTISARVVALKIDTVEIPEDIRNRIVEAQKKRQLSAGYVLDWVCETLKGTQYAELAESMMRSLSFFDVHANHSMDMPDDINPVLAVMYNIITRGLPTRANVKMESHFCRCFNFSDKNDDNSPFINFPNRGKVTAEEVFEALHIIDPRFKLKNYNNRILESSFEKTFIGKYLKDSDSSYLSQLLEPQRWLSSIMSIPNNTFGKDQRADFALEIPYLKDSHTNTAGFIIEIDGKPYHSNIESHIQDDLRNKAASESGWDTFRLKDVSNNQFLKNWESDDSYSCYLQIIKKNFERKIEGEWKAILQSVLSPFAVARLEIVILQAIMSDRIHLSDEKWKIAVIERDVPCAYLAFEELKDMYEHLCKLQGEVIRMPKLELHVFSTEEFNDSPLHLGHKTLLNQKSTVQYDLCIDIAMLLRDKIDAYRIDLNSTNFYLIRSSHYKKEERKLISARSIAYQPLVKKSSRGIYEDILRPKKHLLFFLRNIFRKSDFRKGQLPILSRILSNKTTIGLLPTGGGKSLTYQLASMLQPGVTVVVDPLISLMVDQYNGLKSNRIDSCACINSTISREERERILGEFQNGQLHFLLLSPERYMMENFRSSLYTMSQRNHVYFSYGVIDEVHCVSEWGHDFRPAYLQLGYNMIRFMKTKSSESIAVVGLTATASFDVLADVERELTLGGQLVIDSDTIVRPEMEERQELTYKIVEVRTDFSQLKESEDPLVLSNVHSDFEIKKAVSETKRGKILELLQNVPHDLNEINDLSDTQGYGTYIENFTGEDFFESDDDGRYNNAGIIFCPHAHGTFGVKDSEYGNHLGIESYLNQNEEKLKIGSFIGGALPTGDMKKFTENEQNLMVATKAFGMGIDKPNVRYTIHLNHPSSIEDYVQGAGRAGRDRKNAVSYVIFDPTQYICLSMTNIIDIYYLCQDIADTSWMKNYKNKYILRTDFISLCRFNGCTKKIAQEIQDKAEPYFENVDEDIELFFYNNSFKGAYKEKLMLYEMTYRIMNVKPRNIALVQQKLRDVIGNEDIVLHLDAKRKAIKVTTEDGSKQYGYLFIETLRETYNYSNFEKKESTLVIESLKDILSEHSNNTYNWINQPQSSVNNDAGIYEAMGGIEEDGCTYVTVTWSNQADQDPELYKAGIIIAINEIAAKYGWNKIDELHYGELKVDKINDFEGLLREISKRSNDERWLVYHNNKDVFKDLFRKFWIKRDKDDTDKAIYRLSCIGLIEDVTINYLSETYQLKIRKRPKGGYYQHLQQYFEKYFSPERAKEKVEECKLYQSKTELDKCIGYLTSFVYNTLAKKRRRAIEDMRYVCYEGISKGEESLKDFIHLYFNSKYARNDYEVNGKNYSLSKDVVKNNECNMKVVNKYIDVVKFDDSGSEVDNVKHLYGAVLLSLRDKPENYALHILRAYCLAFLGVGENEVLFRDFKSSLIDDGFSKLVDNYNSSEIFRHYDKFVPVLRKVSHDQNIKNYLKEARKSLSLMIYGKWFLSFSNKYLS